MLMVIYSSKYTPLEMVPESYTVHDIYEMGLETARIDAWAKIDKLIVEKKCLYNFIGGFAFGTL
jgi:hypothetical protein